jgi:hypothetical protein
MGVSPRGTAGDCPPASQIQTFAVYVPQAADTVSAGTRRVYGSYWERILDQWGKRRLDEITPSEVRELVEHVKVRVVARRNARGGRNAAEHLIGALRCLYRRAEDDGFIKPSDNPAAKVSKPRRLASTRRAVADTRLAEINDVAATTGNDPSLDALLLRPHTETVCRRGGALLSAPVTWATSNA